MGMTWWLIAPVLCVFWLVLVGAIVWMSIALAKALRERRAADAAQPTYGASPGETPLATLQRRLAHGDVDVETYERSVAALMRTPSTAGFSTPTTTVVAPRGDIR
ncbi:hypothetical protein [Xylanimonas sp. McL0601]|uniref:hypothetical protein n=1 Tax=Xylanimonas sp. McL0601 TaxID=3414739 RepID=UPI003CEA6E73